MRRKNRGAKELLGMLLALSCLLSGCVFFRSKPNTDPTVPVSQYGETDDGPVTAFGEPITESSTQSAGNVLIFYDKIAPVSLSDMKDNPKARRLSYDDIVSLIADSVSLYDTYDVIVLRSYFGLLVYDHAGEQGDYFISTRRDDPSYDDSIRKINQAERIRDIYRLVLYRLARLDNGLRHYFETPGTDPEKYDGQISLSSSLGSAEQLQFALVIGAVPGAYESYEAFLLHELSESRILSTSLVRKSDFPDGVTLIDLDGSRIVSYSASGATPLYEEAKP